MKGWKIARLLAWLMVVAVIAGVLIVGTAGNLKSKASTDHTAETSSTGEETGKMQTKRLETGTQDISNINVITCIGRYVSVYVEPLDSDQLEYEYYNVDDPENTLIVTSQGGELTIEVPSQIKLFNFVFPSEAPKLILKLPTQYQGDFEVSTSSGMQKIEIENTLNSIVYAASSGRIVAPILRSKTSANIATTSGALEAEDVQVQGDLIANAHSGAVRLGQVTAGGNIIVSTTSGSLTVKDLEGHDLQLSSSSGAQHLGHLIARGEVLISATSGSVSADQITAKQTLTAEVSSGKMVFGEIAAEEAHVKSTSGGIHIKEMVGKGSILSSSGRQALDNVQLTGDLFMEATSGAVKVNVAESTSVRVVINTSSGSMHYDRNHKEEVRSDKKAQFVIGTGTHQLDIKTSSGSITVDS